MHALAFFSFFLKIISLRCRESDLYIPIFESGQIDKSNRYASLRGFFFFSMLDVIIIRTSRKEVLPIVIQCGINLHFDDILQVELFNETFRVLKLLGATGILLEWEDMFPFSGRLASAVNGNAYTRDQVRAFYEPICRDDPTGFMK